MKKLYAWLIGGVILTGVGIMLAINPVMQYWRSKHVASVPASPFSVVAKTGPAVVPQPSYFSGQPVRIQIPALSIDLAVIDGYYNRTTKSWTLTNDKVQFAAITSQPNNREGNTFIYGHNRRGVFDTLNKIRPADEAMITTTNGHTFTYKFRSAIETNPNDASLFDYQGPPILTLQTCSGVWYQNRQLFTFDLVRAL